MVQHEQARFGLQKTSLIDFPGRVAAIVFTSPCNLRCPWCHNGALLEKKEGHWYSLAELERFLQKRAATLGALVLSGGEPLLSPLLSELLKLVRQYELPWKLDTNGTLPGKLAFLLEAYPLFLPELISVDLKMKAEHYPSCLAAPEGAGEGVYESLKVIRSSGATWEARTTFHPDIVSIGDLSTLAGNLRKQIREDLISEPLRWSLQPFRPGHCLDAAWDRKEKPSPSLMEEARTVIETAGFATLLRGA